MSRCWFEFLRGKKVIPTFRHCPMLHAPRFNCLHSDDIQILLDGPSNTLIQTRRDLGSGTAIGRTHKLSKCIVGQGTPPSGDDGQSISSVWQGNMLYQFQAPCRR
eukprot:TRINITY_DN6288_c0_g1_i1.p1 TRINITY_DN6288_c0_g1~~TRINITY_DN6288_c0_g1_i1.p1  ORF type:complete len:105 (-),score=11.61 TRINITY_DN6288_c0_g1_i1:145-459(-)